MTLRGAACPASCLVMAGGRGERLGGPLKPLTEVCGEPMILRVVRALASSGVCRIIAVAYSRRTSHILSLPWDEVGHTIVFIETPGMGYARDLREALREIPQPTLVFPADMPHLTGRMVAVIARELCSKPWGVVNLEGPRGLTGVSLHRSWKGSETWGNVRLPQGLFKAWRFIDVDSPGDLEEAMEHCREERGDATGAGRRGERLTSAPH